MPRIIDLSVTIENAMPAHQTMPRPVYRPFLEHEESKALGLGEPGDVFTSAIEVVCMLNHVGTHIDAFFHTNPDGATNYVGTTNTNNTDPVTGTVTGNAVITFNCSATVLSKRKFLSWVQKLGS